MRLEKYPDRDLMMIDLANRLTGELNEALMVNDHASFAVPGGNTPGPVFDALSAAEIDWPRVHIMLSDERLVPADHDRSNERLLRRRLLVGRAAAATYLSIREDGIDLTPELPLSVLLLGMGDDMHTASLFPGSPDLEAALNSDESVLAVAAPDGLEPRITLTGKVLAGAMNTHVLIVGDAKLEALQTAQTLNATEAPIRTVLANATVHWAP